MWKSGYATLCSMDVLYSAWLRVERNKGCPGVDNESLEYFRENLNQNLQSMMHQLRTDGYTPMPLKAAAIPKDDQSFRVLGIPVIRDRIVFQAINGYLQNIWDPLFFPFSFGYRPGRKVGDAVDVIRNFLQKGYTWYIRGDIRGCFDTLCWELLSRMLRKALPDDRLRRFVNRAIRVPFMYRGKFYERFSGVPQGSPISPILANLYLHQFDTGMYDYGFSVIRYGDDWLIPVRSRGEAEKGFYAAAELFSDLRIEISEKKSGIGDLEKETITFLGYAINATEIAPAPKAWSSVCRALEDMENAWDVTQHKSARARLLHLRSQYAHSGPV